MQILPEGITLEREAGSIIIRGLSSLDKEMARQVVEYVKQNKADLLIEPMTRCLHGGRCKHLAAPGGARPVCEAAGSPVFDLAECPALKWSKVQPKVGSYQGPETYG